MTIYGEEDIIGFKTAMNMAKMAFNRLDEVTEGFIKQRLKHRKSNLPTFGDMLDSLLDHSENNETSFNQHINTLLRDVMVAGTDTVANTTTWIMAELLLNPDMLVSVRIEIRQTMGLDGKIKEAKILDLPYLHDVIKETLRLHVGSPLRKFPGMPLAHRMLSLIVASLVYPLELPYAKEAMDMNDIFGLTLLKATPLVAIPIPLK
ncbi:geraniol 8-hydroxylase-like protein [Tanacetum coccineum]